ncbi:MAG: ABC transporter ATP-binding protein [Anaerolineales bacterium]|nr:ABC transporter ATP-binding protein [Anaerolineales bacterium]
MNPQVFLRAEQLRKKFHLGRKALEVLRGVDLSIRRGEFVAVMGPSGSGKSTLLNVLGGLDRPTSGTIWVEGREITSLDQDALCRYRRDRVGFIFQSFQLLATMTALDNVAFPMVFAGVPHRERAARAERLLAEVGLADRRHHKPSELSGGEQQRVAIARALANSPDLLLADEPTGNLDSATGHEVMEMLTRLHRDGRTLVVVTHDERIARHAQRVLRMLDGRWINHNAEKNL